MQKRAEIPWWWTLHSTMFLLKRYFQFFRVLSASCFTFHNVSIKTIFYGNVILTFSPFTFHNVSIKTCHNAGGDSTSATLHSTMFLLKQKRKSRAYKYKWFFTFHNVSIKTSFVWGLRYRFCSFTFHNVSIKTHRAECREDYAAFTLHSTMFLLKLWPSWLLRLLLHALHSTMFLLKHNTARLFPATVLSLHSTMFLLKPAFNASA